MPDLRAAVIGSGFGGLAAACRLQALGVRTTLFEARDRPGGRAYVYHDAGFTFDAGPTVITAPECLEEVFQAGGRRLADYVELLPVTPLYRLIWPDGVRFDYVQDEAALLEQIRRLHPADADGYRRFAAYARRVFEKGYVELGAKPFLRFWDMVKVAPHLARLRADRSVYQTVARFVTDEHLRQAFSFHPLLIGGHPYETSAIYTLIHHIERAWGVFFPRGGTGALVNAFVRLLADLGGELRLNAPVRAVRVAMRAKGRSAIHHVTTDAAGTEPFDLVVSNADVYHTYATLYRQTPQAAPTVRRLERMEWSMSLVVIYFGTNVRYPELAHHTILFGPRYKGLLDDIFHGARLPEDFSLYLHAPTVTDPSLAPPGCEAFYVLSPVPHLGRAPIDWAVEGPRYADRILERLEEHLPGLRRHIVTRRVFTPADFATVLNARHGSAFSVAPRLTQSAYFRLPNRDRYIPGLYLVGAGTHPGAGVPGVVNSAKATVSVIAQDYQL
ncbi:MAG: phytoene desaturase [Gemmataceae bacterium]|nr:phytoene desaturase [Gemmata sp.]MDW8199036.1 phytoene desaturase [Gemmataceae bacterium]